MANEEIKKYDIVVFGASGFTGKYVIREALKFLSSSLSVAIAGRNPTKLAAALEWAAAPSPPPPLPILLADVSDHSSLLAIASQTKLLLSCVGPFRLYGPAVVAACVESGADYLDITGEPEFMERMEAEHHEKAVKSGSLVVSGCGSVSVVAELGILYNSRKWMGVGVVNRVESYLRLESEKKIVLNLTTYESAVHGVPNAKQLQELRRSRPRRAKPNIPGPPPPKGPLIEYQETIGLWGMKLPTADSTVVRRTLATLTQHPHGLPGVEESDEYANKRKNFWSSVKPAHFSVKVGAKSLLGILHCFIIGFFTRLFIDLLGNFALGRSLLLAFPEIFSLGWFRKMEPTEEEVESTSFKMWFIGHGYSFASQDEEGRREADAEIITRVSGPDSAYLTTSIVLIQCALIVLGQRDNLPKGGVYTPGIVFGPTDLQHRLQENGIAFDVISVKTSQAHKSHLLSGLP